MAISLRVNSHFPHSHACLGLRLRGSGREVWTAIEWAGEGRKGARGSHHGSPLLHPPTLLIILVSGQCGCSRNSRLGLRCPPLPPSLSCFFLSHRCRPPPLLPTLCSFESTSR